MVQTNLAAFEGRGDSGAERPLRRQRINRMIHANPSHRAWPGISAGIALAALVTSVSAAAPQTPPSATPQQARFFESQIRPVLIDHCLMCHGAQQQQSGLRLDSREAILKGGARGPEIGSGSPGSCRLIQAVLYTGALKMPPAGKLKPNEIAALTEWVRMGAPWPAAAPAVANSGGFHITAAQRAFWSFQPVAMPEVPALPTSDGAWRKNPVDRFILAGLERHHLRPAPPADRRTLIRRVTFDLIGLPPTSAETAAFLADRRPDAWHILVNRLLASPRYGERWGRHWLDVARYADTKGYVFTQDPVYHTAWTYRDYVIGAFNHDLPWNQFLAQQIAADLLPTAKTDPASLAALGFLTLGRRFLNDPVLINDDRIDATCRGMMGLTVECARCHDHKFDPIAQADYYGLYGVFASSREPASEPVISPPAVGAAWAAWKSRYDAATGQLNGALGAAESSLRKSNGLPPHALAALAQTPPPNTLPAAIVHEIIAAVPPDQRGQLAMLESNRAALKAAEPPAPVTAMALEDAPQPFQPHIFFHGNAANPGPAVTRHFPAILSMVDNAPYTTGSGRLQLAEDIVSPRNPLTARVIVNRVWLYHFGAGIVTTPSDFGARGDPPTHPKLLDWLAFKFMQPQASGGCGWSIKALHRLILGSCAYRMSDTASPRAAQIDPQNGLLQHQNLQRLDLEALRDSLLAVSGRLDLTAGGPSVDITSPAYSCRRTVYGFVDRQNLPALFRTFDFASPDATSPQRRSTTVPQQALFMLNSPFIQDAARGAAALARRTIPRSAAHYNALRIQWLYQRLFARPAGAEEVAMGRRFLNAPPEAPPPASVAPGGTQMDALSRYVQALLMTDEFAFVD
ncbi:MAG: PSD1 domain-containing protein [Armatimonadetes bacterium]|nr:PSD1 domain-containing protein [Armatimonadota bacterium]MDE2206209.1 PSD1 domain-containing protein [Armatimonadota bacterium]